MSDNDIVKLYLDRSSEAISKTAEKYGSYCNTVANNILGNMSDAEECTNDAYLKCWNTIPPKKPENLRTYIGKLVRNISLDRYKYKTAEKRSGTDFEAVLDELAEIVSGSETVESELEKKELALAINSFLDTVPKENCNIFICRYWYAFPVSEIAKRFGKTRGGVTAVLSRMRSKLKIYLNERGYEL